MDLFYFFFHLWINLWKEKTQICLISTNYYITADWAFKLRKDIKNRTIIKKLINLNELKIFESAKWQHNIITLLEKWQNSVNFSKNCITARKWYYADSWKVLDNILGWKDTDTKYYNIQQSLLYEWDQFYIRLNWISKNTNDGIWNILNKIKESWDTLKNIVNINQWLVSWLNKISESHISKYPNKNYNKDEGVFVLTNKEINEKNINSKYVRPFFKNSDIHKYYTKKSNDLNVLYFKDNWNKHEIDDEKILEHFIKYKELLIDRLSVCKKNKFQWNIVSKWINREDYYLLFYPRNLYQFENEKIVVPYRSKENTFWYSIWPWYGASDMYFITEKDSDYSIKYLLGLLNSQLYYLWLCEKGKRKWEILELFVTPLSEIPIKKISKEEQKPFINLVDQILEITKNEDYLERDDLINQVKILENRIDELVYNLYELSPEEIEIVKNTVK
jgi:adenine-specific DNA-methyltransferase